MTLKERRTTFNQEMGNLEAGLQAYFHFEKTSQLRNVKLAVMILRKEKKFAPLRQPSLFYDSLIDSYLTIDNLDQVSVIINNNVLIKQQ